MACFILTGLLGAVIIIAAYCTYIYIYQYTYWKRRRMLHLNPVPLLGNNAPILFRSTSMAAYADNLCKQFPGARYFGFFDFTKPSLLVKDLDLVREVFVKNFDSFTDHDSFVTEEMDPIVGRNLFSLQGQRWRDARAILSPSFTASRMKILFGLITECANEFVQHFVDHPELAEEFEAKDAFSRYTNDVIATSAFGVKVNSMKDRENDFYRHGTAATAFSGFQFAKFMLSFCFPRLVRLLGGTFLPGPTDRFFKDVITNTVRTREKNGIVRQDMINLMMQAMKKDGEVKVTMDDIIGQAFIFFLAGFDTSSGLMGFVAHELAANPDIQEKLRKEIDEQLAENNGEINYESLGKMKYLDMVISETLRKYPVAPIKNRVCVKEYEFPPPMEGYPSYRVEKDTVLMFSTFSIHRDPKYYSEPDKFIPERFSEENKGKIDPYAYLPFGLGPRQCIGNRFALMETKILFISLLRKFVIKFIKRTQHPVIFDKTSFSLTAEGGFWLKLEERKKLV